MVWLLDIIEEIELINKLIADIVPINFHIINSIIVPLPGPYACTEMFVLLYMKTSIACWPN